MNYSVTIIVPVYNVEKYIEQCVVSLFEQDFENIEYIFVNDCTPDNSIAILEQVIEKYPNRKPYTKIIHHQQNKGLGAARKTGILNATGEYTIQIDSDDWCELDMISSLYQKAKEDDADMVVCDLTNRFETIKGLFANKSIFYLDIPCHNNIGDLLIMHGTLGFFKKNKINCKFIGTAIGMVPEELDPSAVIVLHGGGNLGDLYNLHQEFRNSIIKKFRNNKIIIFPQTIYFESEKEYQNCCQLYSNHPDLHIFVRDKESFRLAQAMSNHVSLMPDMAHNLYPIKVEGENSKKVLFVNRKDKEKLPHLLDEKIDLELDWQDLLRWHNYLIAIMNRLIKLSAKFKLSVLCSLLTKIWIKYTYYLVHKAISLFSNYDLIYTSRMHGHILACLMDKKNTVLDNSYGKNSSYINLWTADSDMVSIERAKNE